MPLYEYQCEACAQRFEVIQKFSDAAPEACRKCGKGPVRRLASSPAFQFKGTGWYITDYAKGNTGPAAPGSAKDGDDTKKTADPGAAATTSGDSPSGKESGGKTESTRSESTTNPSPSPAGTTAAPASTTRT